MRLGAILLLWLISLPAAAFADAPSAEQFVAQFTHVRISPDGAMIAAIRPHEGRTALVVYGFEQPPAQGHSEIVAIPSGSDLNIIDYQWASAEWLLIEVGYPHEARNFLNQASSNDQQNRLIAVRRNGQDARVLAACCLGNVVTTRPSDPDHIYIQRGRYWDYRVFEVALETGRERRVITGRQGEGYFAADNSGDVRAIIKTDALRFNVYWRDPENNRWRSILRETLEYGRVMQFLKFGGNGDVLYFLSNHEGRRGIYRLEARGDGEPQRVFLHDEFDASGIAIDPAGGQAQYVSYVADMPERHYLDDDFADRERALESALLGDRVQIISSSSDGNRHVVASISTNAPVIYYAVDMQDRTVTPFAARHPGLVDLEMAQPEAFAYSARDGLTIPAYLLVPPGVTDEEPLPLVVWPHGGPFARDDMSFDATRQFLATRGYAIFMPNYRGSTGYGDEYFRAGWGEWGLGMLDDVTDGVRYLIEQGRVDPERICIGGWSYGAYTALQSAATAQGLYRCAAGVNGIYDMAEMRDPSSARFFGPRPGDWTRYFDQAIYRREELQALSPRYRAGEIEVPVLLIASAEDPIAPIAHSEDMARALERSSARFDALFFDAGDHSLNVGPSRVATLQRLEAFFAENLQ